MADNKTLAARIIHTHDVEMNWKAAKNFVPKLGELIIYDPDVINTNVRFKFGDGKTAVNDLPFALDATFDEFFVKNETGDILYSDAGRISEYE